MDRSTLTPHPRREEAPTGAAQRQLVVVANRLPVHRVERDGELVWETSPGGLVSALAPVLEQGGLWLGWPGSTDELTGAVEADGILCQPVELDEADVAGYYEGFSNRTLWPLFHDAVRPPEYHRSWWGAYERVNRRFADAVARSADRDAVVWVQDYHLLLVPALLREARPDLAIGLFLHIPFPPPELFAQLPWREALLRGILGADVFGTQTVRGADNFAQLARLYADAEGTLGLLRTGGRTMRYGAFPISIDFQRYEELARSPEVQHQARAVRERLGAGRKIVLGVDRLDYTKGIDVRLKAFGELLERGELKGDEAVLVQVAVPSREVVPEYEELRTRVEQLVGQINGQHGALGVSPVVYHHHGLPPSELSALYVAADVLLVTPFRDGMNLVCKEFVASRSDERGVLVLSEFAGAARELTAALSVNPHDVDGMGATLVRALHMAPDEAARRMRAMRRSVRRCDVHRWAQSFLRELAR